MLENWSRTCRYNWKLPELLNHVGLNMWIFEITSTHTYHVLTQIYLFLKRGPVAGVVGIMNKIYLQYISTIMRLYIMRVQKGNRMKKSNKLFPMDAEDAENIV